MNVSLKHRESGIINSNENLRYFHALTETPIHSFLNTHLDEISPLHFLSYSFKILKEIFGSSEKYLHIKHKMMVRLSIGYDYKMKNRKLTEFK